MYLGGHGREHREHGNPDGLRSGQGLRFQPTAIPELSFERTVALLSGLCCGPLLPADLPWVIHAPLLFLVPSSSAFPSPRSFYRPAPPLGAAIRSPGLHIELVSRGFVNTVGYSQGLAGPHFSHALCCGLNLQFVTSRFQSSYLFLELPCFYFDSPNPNHSLVFPRKQFRGCLACQDELRGRELNDVKQF